MKIIVINPNTTTSMTAKIGACATSAAAPSTQIIAVNSLSGPPSIEGYYDEVFAIPGMIEQILKQPDADAFIIACFDDTGLDAARCATSAPVIGIGEAGFHFASLISGKFGVVTTLARSIPAIEHNLFKYGLDRRCAGVRASEVPVLDLELPGSDAYVKISGEIKRSIVEDGAEAIVLGCAGMADLAHQLGKVHGVPVLDGVSCAVKLAEGLVGLGIKTSRAGGYSPPRSKTYSGDFTKFSPTGS
jgi:allantoin racemase